MANNRVPLIVTAGYNIGTPFHLLAKNILELTVLRPFGDRKKDDLYAGRVERTSHGVQHACRVAALVPIIANIYRLLGPSDEIGLLTADNLKLLQIVALFHDSCRHDDTSADCWEEESKELCKTYLLQIGVSEETAEKFSSLIQSKEKGGLLGKILQSADCVEIARCKPKLFIERMSLYQDAVKCQQTKPIVEFAKFVVKWIAEQHDIKTHLSIVEKGKIIFFQPATRNPARPELKAGYEHANEAYAKALENLPLVLSNFYSYSPDDHQSNGLYLEALTFPSHLRHKHIVDESSVQIDPAVEKEYLAALAKSLQEQAEKFNYELMDVEFYKMVMANHEKFLSLSWISLRKIISTHYPEQWRKIGFAYRNFSLQDKQFSQQLLNLYFGEDCSHLPEVEIKQRMDELAFPDTLNKTVRWDAYCFVRDHVGSLIQTPDSPMKNSLRPGLHKKNTVFASRVFPYEERHQRFTLEEWEEFKKSKEGRSKHQATSLTTYENPTGAFGHGKLRDSKLVGDAFDPMGNPFNRLFLYDGGTIRRPYEADDEETAERYYQYAVKDGQILFDKYPAFREAVTVQTGRINEALYYLKWDINTSSVVIFSNNFESHCIAQHYARIIHRSLEKQYASLGKALPPNYHVPILFYDPLNQEMVWSCAPPTFLKENENTANTIFNDEKLFTDKIASRDPEFLLLSTKEQCNQLLEKKHNGVNLLFYLICNGFFELVDTVYENTDAYLQGKTLKDYLQENITIAETNFTLTHKLNTEVIPLSAAIYRDRIDLYPFLEYQINFTDTQDASPLVHACRHNKIEALKTLLAYGLKHQIDLGQLQASLVIAADNKDEEKLHALLNYLQQSNIINQKHLDLQTFLIYVCARLPISEKLIEMLLERGADINIKNKFGNTALNYAANYGHLGAVQLLLKSEKKADASSLISSLIRARKKRYQAVVDALAGYVKDAIDKHDNPYVMELLFAAAELDDLITFSMIIAGKTININAPNADGETILTSACFRLPSSIKLIEGLLARGADINVRDDKKNTPLTIAASTGHLPAVQLLLDSGQQASAENLVAALTEASKKDHQAIVAVLQAHVQVALPKHGKPYAIGLLFAAAQADDLTRFDPKMFDLIFATLDINARNTQGETLFTSMCLMPLWPPMNMKVLEGLLARGADINARDDKKKTPLTIAASRGHRKTMQLMLNSAHYRPDADNVIAALGIARTQWDQELVPIFRDYVKFSVAKPDRAYTIELLFAAAQVDDLAILYLIIDEAQTINNPININAPNADGETLLTSACFRLPSSMVLIERLLVHGADINARNRSANTPLTIAAFKGRLPAVQLMLSGPKQPDPDNLVAALSQARKHGNPMIVNVIFDHLKAMIKKHNKPFTQALLFAAVRSNDLATFDMIIAEDSTIDINLLNSPSGTLLKCAYSNSPNNPELISRLLVLSAKTYHPSAFPFSLTCHLENPCPKETTYSSSSFSLNQATQSGPPRFDYFFNQAVQGNQASIKKRKSPEIHPPSVAFQDNGPAAKKRKIEERGPLTNALNYPTMLPLPPDALSSSQLTFRQSFPGHTMFPQTPVPTQSSAGVLQTPAALLKPPVTHKPI